MISQKSKKNWTLAKVIELIGNITMLPMTLLYLVGIIFGMSWLNNLNFEIRLFCYNGK